MERMDKQAKGIGGVGPIVKVTWNDAAEQIKIHAINGDNPEGHLAVCETIGELVSKEESQMLKFKNFGRKSLTELQEKLGELELNFGMDIKQYLEAE